MFFYLLLEIKETLNQLRKERKFVYACVSVCEISRMKFEKGSIKSECVSLLKQSLKEICVRKCCFQKNNHERAHRISIFRKLQCQK